MIRSIVIGVGALAVVALAVWSDHEWRQRERLRQEARIEYCDDPDITEEVHASVLARRAVRPPAEPSRGAP